MKPITQRLHIPIKKQQHEINDQTRAKTDRYGTSGKSYILNYKDRLVSKELKISPLKIT